MAAKSVNRPGELQARRLESVYEQLATLMIHSDAIRLLHVAGVNEWSVMQVLGHMVEMIPYWLGHCRVLITTTGEPPVFGRGMDAPERLAGIERGSNEDPKKLLGLLHDEVKAAASAIRDMSAAEIGGEKIQRLVGRSGLVNQQRDGSHGREHACRRYSRCKKDIAGDRTSETC